MTSKNLYFKLMREDWKNRLWAPALIALGCFFLYPVFLVFLAGRAVRECETAELGLNGLQQKQSSGCLLRMA